jgi:hypothetical protein
MVGSESRTQAGTSRVAWASIGVNVALGLLNLASATILTQAVAEQLGKTEGKEQEDP